MERLLNRFPYIAAAAALCLATTAASAQDAKVDHSAHAGHGAAHSAHAGHGTDHAAMAKSMFAKLDVNKDGVISKGELPKDRDHSAHFAKADIDKDGKVSAAEFAKHHGM